jgi:hypothetical protein
MFADPTAAVEQDPFFSFGRLGSLADDHDNGEVERSRSEASGEYN